MGSVWLWKKSKSEQKRRRTTLVRQGAFSDFLWRSRAIYYNRKQGLMPFDFTKAEIKESQLKPQLYWKYINKSWSTRARGEHYCREVRWPLFINVYAQYINVFETSKFFDNCNIVFKQTWSNLKYYSIQMMFSRDRPLRGHFNIIVYYLLWFSFLIKNRLIWVYS